ncbi:hypothetical protein A2W24_02350 [Microgenomates group bacterium RBG_16_45_19]|nr:MAG: hypothetical protein A2W24_02350 [Microgenomates group bacterium RBG_16_45_19]
MAYLFNYYTQIIDVLSPQVDVDLNDLTNNIRAAEFNDIGMGYPKICDASGKDNLGGGIYTGIVLYLYPNWQLRFWEGTYTATVRGGNILGGLNNQPIAYVPGVLVQIIQSASSTLVYGTGGLTEAEHDKLMTGLDITIPDGVWDELLAGHTISGSAGRELVQARRKATLASLKK